MTEAKLQELIEQLNDIVNCIRRLQQEESTTNEEYSELARLETDLIRVIQDLRVEGIILSVQEVDSAINSLKSLTEEIENTIDHVKKIDKGIKVATAVVTLGTAIASGNASSIATSVVDIAGLIDGGND